jgi:hypothetical protein
MNVKFQNQLKVNLTARIDPLFTWIRLTPYSVVGTDSLFNG